MDERCFPHLNTGKVDKQMFHRLKKLPVMFVFIMVLLMYVVDATGVGIRFHFSYQGCISAAVFLSGLGIIAIGGYTFKKADTTVNPRNPEQATSLVTTGVYRFSRNPMYIGFLLWLFACAVYIGNIINLLYLPIFVMLVNRIFIRPEEEALGKLFGEEFYRYKSKVKRWL